MPDPADGGQFSSACASIWTHARILLQQFMTPGSPTRHSYSQVIHLVFAKESSWLCRTKHLFYLFLSSYFMVFCCCFVSDWRSPTLSLPPVPFLFCRTRGGEVGAEGRPGVRSLCSQCHHASDGGEDQGWQQLLVLVSMGSHQHHRTGSGQRRLERVIREGTWELRMSQLGPSP